MNNGNLFDLSGKVALVTGASRGIGEGIAKLLAQHGAHVIVSSRKVEGCQAVVDDIIKAGGSAQAIACHIGDMAQIEAIFSSISEQHGKLDILVNNAGVGYLFGPLVDATQDMWDTVINVNLRGAFFGHIFILPGAKAGRNMIGADRIHRDLLSAIFDSGRPRETDKPVLGSNIGPKNAGKASRIISPQCGTGFRLAGSARLKIRPMPVHFYARGKPAISPARR